MYYKGRPTTICSACDDNDGEILYFCDPELVEIALNCMLKKSICKNKKCYLLLFKILYIIIVFKIYN